MFLRIVADNWFQLAAALGATVIATSSSDDKLKVARELGATHTINYRTRPDWAGEVLRLTDGKGADMVVDVVDSSTIEQVSLSCFPSPFLLPTTTNLPTVHPSHKALRHHPCHWLPLTI
jgi:threonine dehydrogenase-like Zn-dependent dehydrogenase